MSDLVKLLTEATERDGSDIFIVPGAPVKCKIDGKLVAIGESRLSPDHTERYLREIYETAKRDFSRFEETGDDDFSFSIPGLARFRVNTYRQRGSFAAVIRVVAFSIPNYRELSIPEEIMSLSSLRSGMILFTGTAGCGKSTTQACLIDRINSTRSCHIITLEDPIEYLHRNQMSIVSQREIAVDTRDYLSALRACLRQAPDVIQLGEMRDTETMRTAMTAAETGHLLIATLHTHGAVNTIDRIIDSFPPDQQNQVRIQLSSILHTIVSQCLVPDINGELVPAFEIMHTTSAVKAMIRDSKNHQIPAAIASGGALGMISMDQSLLALYKSGRITKETALAHAENQEQLLRLI